MYTWYFRKLCRETRMTEISWGKAFGYGARFILYVIVWAIVGVLIAFAGGLVIASSVNITFDSVTWNTSNVNLGGILGGIVIIIVGEIVVILGAISSYFKLMSKLISESGSAMPRPPPP
jgi:hypothetical protein